MTVHWSDLPPARSVYWRLPNRLTLHLYPECAPGRQFWRTRQVDVADLQPGQHVCVLCEKRQAKARQATTL